MGDGSDLEESNARPVAPASLRKSDARVAAAEEMVSGSDKTDASVKSGESRPEEAAVVEERDPEVVGQEEEEEEQEQQE